MDLGNMHSSDVGVASERPLFAGHVASLGDIARFDTEVDSVYAVDDPILDE